MSLFLVYLLENPHMRRTPRIALFLSGSLLVMSFATCTTFSDTRSPVQLPGNRPCTLKSVSN